MNETRKQIIELIEPYMDKTLSEGCLIEYNGIVKEIKLKLTDDIFEFDNTERLIVGKYVQGITPYTEYQYKILGHYDITAVLKYIGKKGYSYKGNKDDSYLIIHNGFTEEYYLPNKPLILYSPDEELELLNLLKKLK